MPLCTKFGIGYDTSDKSYKCWEAAELVSLHLLAMLLLMWLDFFSTRTHYRFMYILLSTRIFRVLLSKAAFYPARIVAWLMLFLVQDFAFTFERLLSGHFFSLLSLSFQGIASSSHFVLAEGTFCLFFIKDIKKYLPHLFIIVKQHLHVFSLHYLQTVSSFFNGGCWQ